MHCTQKEQFEHTRHLCRLNKKTCCLPAKYAEQCFVYA